MRNLKQWFIYVFLTFCFLSTLVFYGCGAEPLGPYEPLLPAISSEGKFSDRYRLEEEPQVFENLYGKEIVEGSEILRYSDHQEFDKNGKLVVGWSGQLDSHRFTSQLDRAILVEETLFGRHTDFAIGDHLRLKPDTLFPNQYIISKTEFDGLRWDMTFAQEHHLFTLLHSRISNSIRLGTAAGNTTALGLDLGRRNGWNPLSSVRNIENTRLIGFRGQTLLTENLRFGYTYINMHKQHPERIISSYMGTVPNTPPETISIVFRDDSPEDNHIRAFTDFENYDPDLHIENIQGGVGAAFKSMRITIITQPLEKLNPEEINDGIEPNPLPKETHEIDISADMLVPIENSSHAPEIRDSIDGEWKIVTGFHKMKYVLDFYDIDIDPRTVKSVVFDMIVAGDYNIAVIGISRANQASQDPDLQEWIKTTDGHIQIPYRDIIQAPGNYGQSPEYIDNREKLKDNPNQWKGEGRPRKVRYQFGAARAATLYGIDLEGRIGNVRIRTHYSINGKHKQYPTIPKEKVGYSRKQTTVKTPDGERPSGVSIDPSTGLYVDAKGIPTYSETEGERFEAFLGVDGTDIDADGKLGREKAWFIHLESRFEKLHMEGVLYHIDPGYTTTYLNFGTNLNRDTTFTIDRNVQQNVTPEEYETYDANNYILIEDDDDEDGWPDDIDFDNVLPRADDRDQNGILDFHEDFLIFYADPPVFKGIIDLNNNGVIDTIEDDLEPQYEYGIDRQGYHINAKYYLLANLSLQIGWLNEREVSSRRKNNSKYVHLIYDRDIPDFGSISFQNRFVRVQDDIPDYTITLPVGELETVVLNDDLDYYNARVNTTIFQCIFSSIENLTLEAKSLVVMQKQMEIDKSYALFTDVEYDPLTENFEADERIDFMVLENQLSGDYYSRREVPFYPDHGLNALDAYDTGLIYDDENWTKRRYPDRNIRNQLTILKGRYEIPISDLPQIDRIGVNLVLTPMVKYVWDRAFDRTAEEIPKTLNPDLFSPTDVEVIEYLRFNRRSREDILGIRLDYHFSPKIKLLGGFQYRKFVNRDTNIKKYLQNFPINTPISRLHRPDIRTRILELQTINRGQWLGATVIILAGVRRTTNLLRHTVTNSMYIKAIAGF